MQNSLYKLFEHKCVLKVCVHIHPIMIKIHPVFLFYLIFFIPIFKFSNQAVLRFLSEWCSSAQAAPSEVDWQGRLTLDPPWMSCHQSAIVSTPVQGKTRKSQIKWLRCFVVGCNNEYSSRHLLPTSEPLKMQRINVTFVFEGNVPIPICLNASIFAQIIRDPASSTEVSISFFFYLCKSQIAKCAS